jgi:hypothetical protein
MYSYLPNAEYDRTGEESVGEVQDRVTSMSNSYHMWRGESATTKIWILVLIPVYKTRICFDMISSVDFRAMNY